jgi:hypothetical protein
MESTFSKHKHVNQVSLKPGKCNCCNLGMGTLDFYDEHGYHLFSYIISEENRRTRANLTLINYGNKEYHSKLNDLIEKVK